jgi:hypothetical protein
MSTICIFVLGQQILRLLLHAIHSHLQQLILSTPPPHGFLGLDITTATAESRLGLGFVYIISVFTFNSSIIHYTPMVSEIYTKQSINEENSSLFMNSIL